ncbi:MAG: hypothetical protein KME16_12730 [Scytolyngbya sp. HA4215-MV1]|jgi:hypothetical protein|nr:hypothetical protein [Scytolyngbya sp. HA4215-MV1]
MATNIFRKTVLTSLVALAAVLGLSPVPASAGTILLDGFIDPNNSFPTGYIFPLNPNAFGGLTSVHLIQCLPSNSVPQCGPLTQPNPNQPISFPNNFPSEFFYYLANAKINSGGLKALLVLSTQGAFANGNLAIPAQQVTFSRLRIRISGLVAGHSYRITHPYGVGTSTNPTLVADSSGSINVTEDYGCGAVIEPTCDFSSLTTDKSPHNPLAAGILEWDTNRPFGFIGDGVTPHTVTGSPNNTNYFEIFDITANRRVAITTLFTVMGKIAP